MLLNNKARFPTAWLHHKLICDFPLPGFNTSLSVMSSLEHRKGAGEEKNAQAPTEEDLPVE